MKLGKMDKSKVASHKIITGNTRENGLPSSFGKNKDTFNVPFKSGTKAASDPTTKR